MRRDCGLRFGGPAGARPAGPGRDGPAAPFGQSHHPLDPGPVRIQGGGRGARYWVGGQRRAARWDGAADRIPADRRNPV